MCGRTSFHRQTSGLPLWLYNLLLLVYWHLRLSRHLLLLKQVLALRLKDFHTGNGAVSVSDLSTAVTIKLFSLRKCFATVCLRWTRGRQ